MREMSQAKTVRREFPVSQGKMKRMIVGIMLGWGVALAGLFTLGDIVSWLIGRWQNVLVPTPIFFALYGLLFGYATFLFFHWVRVMTDPAPLELLIHDETLRVSTPFKTVELPLSEVDRASVATLSGQLQFFKFRHEASSQLAAVDDIVCIGYDISTQNLAKVINRALGEKL